MKLSGRYTSCESPDCSFLRTSTDVCGCSEGRLCQGLPSGCLALCALANAARKDVHAHIASGEAAPSDIDIFAAAKCR